MTTRRTLLAIVALTVLCATVALAQYAGPKLEGTATLRSGETISGVVLSAQLGIVDGAEIGSSLTDGGYISIAAAGGERAVKATEIVSLDVEWANTGTPEASKWKIARLTVITTGGETIAGEPTWLVHATSLNVEQADGARKKVYAFPLAGANFSADNLLARLVLGASAPVTDLVPVTPTPTITPVPAPTPPTTDTPTTTEVVTIEPVTPTPAPTLPTTDTPVVTPTPAPPVVTPTPYVPDMTPTVTVAAPPLVTNVPAGAIIVFEVINPETGNPMRIKFLLVPLAVE